MAKLHKTFESFLTAWEHKGEFAQTLFAKRFFCRKLYLVQRRSTETMPQKTGLHRRLKKRLHRKLRRETSMMLLVPGRMEWGHIHCNQGHGATLCKMRGQKNWK